MNNNTKSGAMGLVVTVFVILAGVVAAAWVTGLWVLTAIPIGILFGFFLQKGDLCGASAFSEVILMKDWRKTWGLWVCIATGMVSFAALDLFGLVQLNPKPFLWASLLVGGLLFGVGMVLTGGCVSGTLYKAGIGHINSIVALLGIPVGIAMVEYGPLNGLHLYLKTFNAGRITFPSVTGLPYWGLAILFASGTLAVALWKRDKSSGTARPAGFRGLLAAKSWRPWVAGIAIGVLGAPAYLSSAASGRNYPLGVTHGVVFAELAVTDHNLNFVYEPARAPDVANPSPAMPANPGKKVSLWLLLLVLGVIAGSWTSARISGQARLIAKPPEQILVALAGSVLVGAGAALATGCVIGNILSGVALMSVGMVFFAAVVILANWATTYVYLMGGSLRQAVQSK